ncbi:MAG TPA: S9 family peptidase [Chitinophagaceae bacterium]|nr:S9 family peptidase [Chitinophagaceae bacterium]
MKGLALAVLMFCQLVVFAQRSTSVSFEKWISLKGTGGPLVSPDGKTIVYSVTSTDWANNSYDTELWMVRDGGAPVQLTRTDRGSSFGARFTPDSKFISFLADRGQKTQIYLISVHGGEAMQLTKDEDGINNYEWSPDGSRIAYSKPMADSKRDKTMRERFGAFGVEGEEYKLNHLWILNYNYDTVVLAGQVPCYPVKKDSSSADSLAKVKAQGCVSLPVAKQLTQGDFTVGGYAWHPDGQRIIFNRQANPLINSGITADIVLMDVATKKMTTLVSNPTGDFFSRWNPQGTAFVYSSAVTDSTSNYYKNNRLFIYDMNTNSSREIAKDIDENKFVSDWNKHGLFVGALEKTKQKIFTVDPASGASTPLPIALDLVGNISFSMNTDIVAVSGRNYADLNEIYTGTFNQPLTKVTNNSAQIANWNTPVNEVISWKSKDGAAIEGVLLKPRNYDPAKKYPLLIVIHGGPTGIDLPDPTPTYVYPIMQWVEKGALVLRVNYRGSAGYGEKFRSLNVRNLGVGDMWDVVSGVEHLQKKGMIDTARMGVMGWSQGGYISAFLATNTNIFKAISVGAGISNWVTYYVNTDITPFTRQYLQATPWNDMAVYLKTSPMTNINKARTPTLIQHGEFDRRVPIPNAYELYRGLQDRGVPSKLIVYKGFGHGINKPKERLAAVWHNWQWFNKYVFGEAEEPMPLE